ncbi:SMC5-SMC6 complex localization factor protein 2 isoform X2 [Alligator sinensis]|uniref:SMC5-SMC6 complex localization factor protein 2 isoform X2 n=1 Tax=Alligator sinensis TaxID=38654 RepID=A0A3Q0GBJ9_ALLSI|nr:SMC5-SMC6 complex localization factor protein 2 isoform X2 [Alligator sinensis]
MTRHLGAGSSSQGSPAGPPRRHFKPAAAEKEGAGDGSRNHSITDYFKPASKQERRNVKNGEVGLSVIHAERFEKAISSPEKGRRKKMPVQTPTKSPVLDALLREAKKEKKDNLATSENSRKYIAQSTIYPKVVVRKLFLEQLQDPGGITKKQKDVKHDLGRNEKGPVLPRTPLSCGNSREWRTDYVDLEEASSGSNKRVLTPEADALKDNARSIGNMNGTSWSPRADHSPMLQRTPGNSQFRLSLDSYNREREKKKQRMERAKQHSVTPVKALSGTSVSNQDNGGLLKKRPYSASWETPSDQSSESKLVSKPKVPSPNQSGRSSEKSVNVLKSQSFPSLHLNSEISSEPSKHTEFPGKRKRISMHTEMKSSGEPHSHRSEQHKNGKSEFIKLIKLKSPQNGILQLEDAATSAGDDMLLSEDYRDLNEKDNSSPVDSRSGCNASTNDQMCVADSKENNLQVTHSQLFLEKSHPFSQEKPGITNSPGQLTRIHVDTVYTKETECLPRSSQVQTASVSSLVLGPKKERDPLRPTEPVLCKAGNTQHPSNSNRSFSKSRKNREKTSEDASKLPTVEISEKPVSSVRTGKKSVARSLSFKGSANNPSSSQFLNELDTESHTVETSVLNGNLRNSFDSEYESIECNLESEEEEEILLPLQEILSLSSKPQNRTPDRACLQDLSQDTMSPSQKLPLLQLPVVTEVSYVNSLEHLVKEKEESKRVAELEKQLQKDIQRTEVSSSVEVEDESTQEDGDLSEEHRAFLQRFSVITDAIPDYHPGEEIFHFSNSGRIFSHHNLDLRNFGFNSQNPIEKLLLSSEVRQQLSLTTQGFLSSAYSCTQCPMPVLKWLFQMMSVHSDCYVSTRMLDVLMEMTIKNASIGAEHFRPWVPSLSDISAVLINMGVHFSTLFPLKHLQPSFSEGDILSKMQMLVMKPASGNISSGPAFSCLPETNLINVIKFLAFCTTIYQDVYTDQELLLLLLLLFKISLEKLLKQIPLIDLQCLVIKLLKSMRDWDAKMSELCLAMSDLSSHHHDLLWLVQLVPSWVTRGRQVRRCLSLIIISKFLNQKNTRIPDTSDQQLSHLYQYLVYIKPSSILKKKLEERMDQQGDLTGEYLQTELEQQAYYLTYILLHLVSEVCCFDVLNSNQRQHLLRLSSALDKHVKCDIREDARLFYRTKVKDLVARIYGKWQEMIQNSRPTQGKLHDFWVPDS